MSRQVTFDLQDSLDKVSKNLENLPLAIEAEFNQAVKDIAYAAYASIMAKAQAELNSTRQDYLKGLDITDLGDNSYLISLDGIWANKIEDGFASYDLTEVLLRSNKIVDVGRRTGYPWVQEAKDGHKYAYVPMQRNPHSKAPKNADMAAAIREMTAMNAKGRKQKLTATFKDALGNPLEGKVAMGKSTDPRLDNLVKYQKAYTNDKGKQTTQSIYINYRCVSENGKSWIHPGYKGLLAFQAAEQEIEQQLNNIVRVLLG